MKKIFLLLGLLLAFWGAAFAAVNINTATKEELDALKGIGPVKAQAIIDYRTKNGPFQSVDDLRNVKGIGAKTLEEIRQDVTISGPGTAAKPAVAPAKAPKSSPPGKTEKPAAEPAGKAPMAAPPAPAAKTEPVKTPEPSKAKAKKEAQPAEKK